MEKLISKASKFVVKEMNDDKRIVKGMASVFDNLDSDMDVMQKVHSLRQFQNEDQRERIE